MSHPNSPADAFDRGRIEELLSMLDQRLRGLGVSRSVYVVGGAAVAVTVTDRRVTRDVDVASLDAVVAAQVREIAAVEALPATWLNASAAPWIPAPAIDIVDPPVDGPGLAVRYAPPDHLLAMKMVSLRQQDAPDIAALAAHLGLRSAVEFSSVLRSVYADEGVLPHVLGVPDDQVDVEVDAIASRVAAFVAAQL